MKYNSTRKKLHFGKDNYYTKYANNLIKISGISIFNQNLVNFFVIIIG